MKCLVCHRFSLWHICKECQALYLQPRLFKQKLPNGIEVFSFYMYEDIKPFLHTKHTSLGYDVFHILAKSSTNVFAKHFFFETEVASLGIDENPKNHYSHTAILNKHLKSKYIKPYYGKLLAKNPVQYSGKSKSFREQNPRDFSFKQFREKNCIVVDDIITTGTTLLEATTLLKNNNKEVLFCLTLASVKQP